MTFDDWKKSLATKELQTAEQSIAQLSGPGPSRLKHDEIWLPNNELALAMLEKTGGLTDFKLMRQRWVNLGVSVADLLIRKDPNYLTELAYCFAAGSRDTVIEKLIDNNLLHIAGAWLHSLDHRNIQRNMVSLMLKKPDGAKSIADNIEVLDGLTADHAAKLVEEHQSRAVATNLARFTSIRNETVVELIGHDSSVARTIFQTGVCTLDSKLARLVIETFGAKVFTATIIHLFDSLDEATAKMLYAGGESDALIAHAGRFQGLKAIELNSQ